jgi:putative hydrolase of the HAD superfamily
VFKRYEKGEFTDEEFRNFCRKELNISASDQAIDKAWDALLKAIPKERVDLLKELKNKYRTFLLSNTNSIHIKEVNNILYKDTGVKNLDLLFEKVYYSYEMKMSKPDLEIYDRVVKENNLYPNETLFIDDNLDNIIGAKAAGLQTLHVVAPESILELLKNA